MPFPVIVWLWTKDVLFSFSTKDIKKLQLQYIIQDKIQSETNSVQDKFSPRQNSV